MNNQKLVEALREIACLTQTNNLLWWQVKAREALAAHESPASESTLPVVAYVSGRYERDGFNDEITALLPIATALADHAQASAEIAELHDCINTWQENWQVAQEELTTLRAQLAEARECMNGIRHRVANDSLAITYQSFGGYRAMLIKAIDAAIAQEGGAG